ncbi:AraC family transcriptional regulator [Bacillus sp. M6-12]|uniref:AraC family transcriptional regulator n=1 Tax=Bacillus sp. M6-12 TaxID=2054166 RepID=UPI0015E14B35|nr:AraC family transcriptional regulator [Bacillus sp. M6-12]
MKLINTKLMMSHFKPYSADPVAHEHGNDFQITIPLSGNSFLEQNQTVELVDKNIRIVTPPGEKHLHFTEMSESRILLININKSFVDKVASSRLQEEITEVTFFHEGSGSSENLIRIADEVINLNLFCYDQIARTEELEWELAETLLSLQEGSHTEKWRSKIIYKANPAINKVIQYIRENFQNELSLDHLAKECNLSKFYMIKLFKDAIGCTPSQYILQIRLDFAVKLMLHTNLPITSICFDAGFASLNTFERVFKKRYGNTISDFRKKHKT